MMLLSASRQRTAQGVQLVLVVMTDHISHEPVSLMLLSTCLEDSSGCAVSLGHAGEPRRQSQPATHDIPTEDSSGCAVSLDSDDRPRQSLDRGADASFNLPKEDSSECAVSFGHGGDHRHQSISRDIPIMSVKN